MVVLNEIELAEYCRKKGVYLQQVKDWKNACMQANGGVAEEASRLNLELKKTEKEKKKLERELNRKEKALAEVTALLVLRKNDDVIWDITSLNSPIKVLHYYLYLISDLFSRKIIGWEVLKEESAAHASELIKRTMMMEKVVSKQQVLVLHSDNGSPMKGATMLETLYDLGIVPSNSRRRVSNDNPYAESIFKILKYRPNF